MQVSLATGWLWHLLFSAALCLVDSSCGPGTAGFTTSSCTCGLPVLYEDYLNTYYCGDGFGDYGALCMCYTGITSTWENICSASYCLGQYCSDITGGCSYCSPGSYSASGSSCVPCSTCSSHATTIGSCSGYGSTSDVICVCNSGYTGNGITCTASTSYTTSCAYGTCDTYYSDCCTSNNYGPVASCCFCGCFTCPIGTSSATRDHCDYCSPGTFSTSSGSTMCLLCPAGSYASATGQNKLSPQ